MSETLTALFVRVPHSLASELDGRSREQGRSKQAVVTDMLVGALGAQPKGAEDEIMDLPETAELLGVQPADVLERWELGDFPGRRLGESLRFSRSAVLQWMSGNDSARDNPTGF